MIETIQIYDEQVHDLINQVDQVCHNFDASKYGIPPEPIRNKIKMLVYRWIVSQQVTPADGIICCTECGWKYPYHTRACSHSICLDMSQSRH